MLHTVSVAGLTVTAATKKEILGEVSRRLEQGETTRIVTPYSEFLFAALKSKAIMTMLNSADISLPDGVGMVWAATYLDVPLHSKNIFVRYMRATWQMMYTGASILLRPKSLYKIIPEKIVGADFFINLVDLAAKQNLSLYLLGGYGDVALQTSKKLRKRHPQLRIAGFSNKESTDPSIITDIQAANPDLLFVAFNPIGQDAWIAKHLHELSSVKLAIGLGGTFDYVSGNKAEPPQFLRIIGLEWLFRLITQPKRYRRIYNATIGLILLLIQYKVEHMDETRMS